MRCTISPNDVPFPPEAVGRYTACKGCPRHFLARPSEEPFRPGVPIENGIVLRGHHQSFVDVVEYQGPAQERFERSLVRIRRLAHAGVEPLRRHGLIPVGERRSSLWSTARAGRLAANLAGAAQQILVGGQFVTIT